MLAREGDKQITLWKKSVILTATADTNGLVYKPPSLRGAVLSPGGSMLLVQLAGSENPEFIVLSLHNAKSANSRKRGPMKNK